VVVNWDSASFFGNVFFFLAGHGENSLLAPTQRNQNKGYIDKIKKERKKDAGRSMSGMKSIPESRAPRKTPKIKEGKEK
jgi:hypothetical protein